MTKMANVTIPKERTAWERFFKANRGDSPFKRLLIHAGLIAYCLLSIYPVLRVFTVSIRPGDRLLSTDLSIIPADATFQAYFDVLFKEEFLVWVWNSIVITGATATIGVILAATSAYAFSRWKFPGRAPGLVFLLSTQMIPGVMLMVPIFILASKLGLTQTYRGLIIAYSVTSVPFSVWVLKGYYDTIPKDLEDAALIDGATRMEAFWRIILPLSSPALAIIFLFNFMAAWSDYLFARVMISNAKGLWPWTLGLYDFAGQYQTLWAYFSAASILVMIPVVALFLYSSKWLISGLTLGSVKG